MTRTPLFAFIVISILLNCSCSKSNNDTPTPTPPVDTTTLVKPDTLTEGWSKIKIDTTQILDIFFNNNNTGYAITDHSSLFKTTNGGLTWAIKNDTVRGINMAVTNNGNIHYINGNGTIHTSVDGGSNFSSITLSPFGESYDLFFPDDNNGFTVCGGVLFQTNNSGINWTAVTPTTGLSLSSTGYYTQFFLNDTTGWICGDGKIFKTNGNLHNWTQSTFTVVPSYGRFVNAYPTSASTIYAVSFGNVFKSIDSGNNFSVVYALKLPTTYPPDIHFIDTNTGYISDANRIYKTTNGGTSWAPVVSLGGSSRMVEIHFTDANHGWGCTTDGYILRYSL